MEHTVIERFAPLRDQPITAARIRCHGDYHLGQVLWTGTRFVVIDFEGEPARPLSERRAKTLAMRDVAAAATYLVSDEAIFVTGVTLPVSGG